MLKHTFILLLLSVFTLQAQPQEQLEKLTIVISSNQSILLGESNDRGQIFMITEDLDGTPEEGLALNAGFSLPNNQVTINNLTIRYIDREDSDNNSEFELSNVQLYNNPFDLILFGQRFVLMVKNKNRVELNRVSSNESLNKINLKKSVDIKMIGSLIRCKNSNHNPRHSYDISDLGLDIVKDRGCRF